MTRIRRGLRQAWSIVKRIPVALAALACSLVGIYLNAEFAAQFGLPIVALAIASDVLKSSSATILAGAIHRRERARATAAMCVLTVTMAMSLASAFGSAYHRRETVTDVRADQIRNFNLADHEHKRLVAELTALGNVRPPAVIRAERNRVPIDMRIWQRSKQCADITVEETRVACAPVHALDAELARANRKAEIDGRLPKLKAVLDKGKPEHADPAAFAIASVIPAGTEAGVKLALAVLIVALIEIGSTLGWVMIAPTRAVTANDNDPPPAKASTPYVSREERIRRAFAEQRKLNPAFTQRQLAVEMGIHESTVSRALRAA